MTITSDNNFTIRDNSSEFARILPEKWIEPLTIIARINGSKGIDDYILELVKDRLEMFTDTRDNLEEDFQKYMYNIMKGKDVENTWVRSSNSNYNKRKGEGEGEENYKLGPKTETE
jgi:hypothetical protein